MKTLLRFLTLPILSVIVSPQESSLGHKNMRDRVTSIENNISQYSTSKPQTDSLFIDQSGLRGGSIKKNSTIL